MTMLSVPITIPVTVILVVPLDLAEGLLAGSYGTGPRSSSGLIFYNRRRLALPLTVRCSSG